MFDYIKVLITNIDTEQIKNKLRVITEFDTETGEVLKDYVKLHCCTAKFINKTTLLFTGSVHKMYNSINKIVAPVETGKGFNGNDFTPHQLLCIRGYLTDLFNCKPGQMKFQNLEIGFNILTDFDPSTLIKGLLYHNGVGFETKHKRQYAEVKHKDYSVKIYNKSKQYGMTKHVLRFELSLNKSRQINELGVATFKDVNTETLTNCKELVLKRLKEVVYFDNTINEYFLKPRQKQLLSNYSNIVYWLDKLKSIHRDRHKKKLADFIDKYSDNLKGGLMRKISKKCVIIHRVGKVSKLVKSV